MKSLKKRFKSKSISFILIPKESRRIVLMNVQKYFQSVKKSFSNRTPREKWCFVRDIAIFMLLFTGVPFFDRNFKLSWLCFIPAIVTVDYVLCFGYTVWYYIGRDSIKAILMIPTLAIFIPVNVPINYVD